MRYFLSGQMSGILGFTFTLQFHLSKHDRNHLGKSNSIIKLPQGVVHKLRLQDEVLVVGPKMSTFCQRLYHINCQRQACRPWVCRVCHGTPSFWQIS